MAIGATEDKRPQVVRHGDSVTDRMILHNDFVEIKPGAFVLHLDLEMPVTVEGRKDSLRLGTNASFTVSNEQATAFNAKETMKELKGWLKFSAEAKPASSPGSISTIQLTLSNAGHQPITVKLRESLVKSCLRLPEQNGWVLARRDDDTSDSAQKFDDAQSLAPGTSITDALDLDESYEHIEAGKLTFPIRLKVLIVTEAQEAAAQFEAGASIIVTPKEASEFNDRHQKGSQK